MREGGRGWSHQLPGLKEGGGEDPGRWSLRTQTLKLSREASGDGFYSCPLYFFFFFFFFFSSFFIYCLVPSSILMAYTLALANSYGCLISELKRQIEKVSQAGRLGKGAPGNVQEDTEERLRLTSSLSSPFISGDAE